ncbi:SURF1 family protein [Kitasatospora sp. NPDC051914]|uniref:SURF1 family protein n=1 Tax=Kitasatospora sp. NPDC051914 TaxID=3154945 RepID=UPI003442206A
MTSLYRFLLTPRWLAGTILALAAIAVCLWLGSWQLGRFKEKAAAQHAAPLPAAPAVPLDQLLTPRQPWVGTDTAGRAVTASGTYDAANQLLVPNRTVEGVKGFYVLTPLRTTDGRAVTVVRGWAAGPATHARPPAPPSGHVTVTGRLHPSENSGMNGAIAGGLPPGQLGTIAPATLVNILPYDVYDGWVAADTAPNGLVSVASLRPRSGSGLNLRAFQSLGYTLEWFVFAGFVVFMCFRLARHEAEAAADRALGIDPVHSTSR